MDKLKCGLNCCRYVGLGHTEVADDQFKCGKFRCIHVTVEVTQRNAYLGNGVELLFIYSHDYFSLSKEPTKEAP
jgi:hypothetical protein